MAPAPRPFAPTLYGIANCDHVKKARLWLAANSVEHRFHDFKRAGLSSELAATLVKAAGWERLVNRKGTTWRGLSEERKQRIVSSEEATLLMIESPSVIKRPVLQFGPHMLVGFDAASYQSLFKTPDLA